MRCGCIDIGSNTTRLLVAEPEADGRLTILHRERVFLPLTGLERRDAVALRRLRALGTTVARLAADARKLGVGAGALRAVATQALRAVPAQERDGLIAGLAEAAGVPVEVLSPEREASLAFRGATAGVHCALAGVIDVGGGSSELITGRPGGAPDWFCSIPLGSRVLTERVLLGDPPTRRQLAAAEEEARAAFAGHAPPAAPQRVWTVGGGMQSLATLLEGRPADADALGDALATLGAAPAIEVAASHGLDELRTRLLPAALILLRAAVGVLGRPAEPGAGGVREGVVHEMCTSA